ncbi:MAG: leucine-rich repeat domain-containing protein [Clostridia bacterium]|nr:leucine-rich repeat domain-containing protein [Clostridia bacterium]
MDNENNKNTAEQENGERRHLSSAERRALYEERARARSGRVSDIRKKKKIILSAAVIVLTIAILAVSITCIVLNKKVWTPRKTYNSAMALFESGEYLRAYDIFLSLGSYENCPAMCEECILRNAKELSGKDDVIIGSTASMPWFSLANDSASGVAEADGYIKFDAARYKGDSAIVIPDVFNGILVRGIYDKCFFWCDFVTSVEIPASVEYIGERAFFACAELKELTVPDSVKKIGENAFASCIVLEKIRLGKGIKEIPPRAFKDAVSLTEIVIPEGVTVIGVRAFNGCAELKEISLPSTLETVSNYAFTGCQKLKKISFAGTREKLASACTAEDAGIILKCADISYQG